MGALYFLSMSSEYTSGGTLHKKPTGMIAYKLRKASGKSVEHVETSSVSNNEPGLLSIQLSHNLLQPAHLDAVHFATQNEWRRFLTLTSFSIKAAKLTSNIYFYIILQ